MRKLCIITGVSGSLGQAISKIFIQNGYEIFGIDILKPKISANMKFSKLNLNHIVHDSSKKAALFKSIDDWKGKDKISVLINNAAYQFIKIDHPLNINEFTKTLNTNLLVPYVLISHFANDLESNEGSVVNVSSIHARLTKPGFSFTLLVRLL